MKGVHQMPFSVLGVRLGRGRNFASRVLQIGATWAITWRWKMEVGKEEGTIRKSCRGGGWCPKQALRWLHDLCLLVFMPLSLAYNMDGPCGSLLTNRTFPICEGNTVFAVFEKKTAIVMNFLWRMQCGEKLTAAPGRQPTEKWGIKSYNFKELNAVSNPNELKRWSFPSWASRETEAPTSTLITALWDARHREPKLFPDSWHIETVR